MVSLTIGPSTHTPVANSQSISVSPNHGSCLSPRALGSTNKIIMKATERAMNGYRPESLVRAETANPTVGAGESVRIWKPGDAAIQDAVIANIRRRFLDTAIYG